MSASYFASLFNALNPNFTAYLKRSSSGLMITTPTPDPQLLEDPSTYIVHSSPPFCSVTSLILESPSYSDSFAMKSAKTWDFSKFSCLKVMLNTTNSTAHFASLPDRFSFDNIAFSGKAVMTYIEWH